MSTSLSKLIVPPLQPGIVPDTGWHELESVLGVPVPRDYKEFIQTYGSGKIDDFLLVLNPFEQNENLNLLTRGERILGIYEELQKSFPDTFPFPVFPLADGLLPWGTTDNGDALFWRCVNKDPESWTIVVYDLRSQEYVEYQENMVDFLVAILSRRIVCPMFPDDFPSEHITFQPILSARLLV